MLKNRGNYENTKMSITADIYDGDDIGQVLSDLDDFLNHKLNAETREAQYEKFKEELEVVELSEAERIKREKWVAKYEDFMKKIESLEFVHVK